MKFNFSNKKKNEEGEKLLNNKGNSSNKVYQSVSNKENNNEIKDNLINGHLTKGQFNDAVESLLDTMFGPEKDDDARVPLGEDNLGHSENTDS